ncbi:MAG: hemerythrin family protein [Terracidiphilus sp.]|jgi:hemerythrin
MEVLSQGSDLGISMIDRDHREISELLLEINFNAARDEDADRKIRRLRDLARVTRSHFLLEEAMMTATNYPGLAVHRMRHAWMLEEIRRLVEYWGKEQNALMREPMGLLWESHIEHVESEDRAYGLWLGDTGGRSERERTLFLMSR